jgi:hypothetical protein
MAMQGTVQQDIEANNKEWMNEYCKKEIDKVSIRRGYSPAINHVPDSEI